LPKSILLVVLLSALATFLSVPIARGVSARPYTVEHYSASLTLDLEHRRIEGAETIRVRSCGESITEIELDADEIVVESALVGKNLQQQFSQSVDSVTNRGHVRIRLSRPLKRGKRLNLRVTFRGSPTKELLFFGNQSYTVYNTSHWLVVNHEPSDLATLNLSLNVPANLVVIGNGENVASRKSGNRLISTWKEKRPIPDFVFGFAARPFARWNVSAGHTELRYFSATHSPAQME